MTETNRSRYDTVAVMLHWVIAILMIFMIFFGEDLMGEAEVEAATASTFLPSLHVSIGVTILALSVLRLLWRIMNPPPPLPLTMKSWEVTLSKATHILFYVLMIGLPVMGWLALPAFIAEEPALSAVSVYGLPVPLAPKLGLPAGELHSIGSNVAMVLAILHVLAALKHQFYDRDGLLLRMSPR